MFDHKLLSIYRNKATKDYLKNSFLVQEVTERLADRILDSKTQFKKALVLGANCGISEKFIIEHGIKNILNVDCSERMLKDLQSQSILEDYESLDKIADSEFDLIFSSMYLYALNNPQLYFKELRKLLKKDGMFAISLPTVNNIKEISYSLMRAEEELTGKVFLRSHPFMDIKEIANIVLEAGFKDITSDRDTIEVAYKNSNPMQCFYDLKNMGFGNILIKRNKNIPHRNLFKRASDILQEISPEGFPIIKVEICNLVAWG